jgi:hypothetical protein
LWFTATVLLVPVREKREMGVPEMPIAAPRVQLVVTSTVPMPEELAVIGPDKTADPFETFNTGVPLAKASPPDPIVPVDQFSCVVPSNEAEVRVPPDKVEAAEPEDVINEATVPFD